MGDLSGLPQTIAAVCYFGAVAALAATIVFSIVFVLRPVQHLALGAAEIRNYVIDPRFLIQSPSEIRFRTLKSLLRAAERYERVNKTKATFLKVSAVLFLTGLLLTVALAVTLAIDGLCD